MEEAHFTEALCSEYYALDDEDLPEDAYPLSYTLLGKEQSKDKRILTEMKKSKSLYLIKPFTGGGKTRYLICYRKKIVVPQSLQSRKFCVQL
jgi:hypothetical protein